MTIKQKLLGILQQIIFWSNISSEHPFVIDSFADYFDINFDEKTKDKILSYSKKFHTIKDNAKKLYKIIDEEALMLQEIDFDTYNNIEKYNILANKTQYPNIQKALFYNDKINKIINDFISVDQDWISILEQLIEYSIDIDIPLWQTLLTHILEEQSYALILISRIQSEL